MQRGVPMALQRCSGGRTPDLPPPLPTLAAPEATGCKEHTRVFE